MRFANAALVAAWLTLTVPMAVCAEAEETPTAAQLAELDADTNRNGDIWRALESRRYAEALERAVPQADQGSAVAQYVLGEMRLVGSELDGDPAVAVGWLERSSAAWYPPALVRLAWVYQTGYGGLLDAGRARALRVRWAQVNAAYAGYAADKTKPVLFVHRYGEGPIHRYWKERQGYFGAMARLIKSAATRTADAGDPKPITGFKAPDSCRPGTAPSYEMAVAKIDQLSGSVFVLVDDSGRIEGMVIDGVSNFKLRIAALDLFQKALRSSQCDMKWPGSDRPVEIPFLFRVE